MDPEMIWSLFMDTGAPELYLLYQKAVRGSHHVLENRGACASGNGI